MCSSDLAVAAAYRRIKNLTINLSDDLVKIKKEVLNLFEVAGIQDNQLHLIDLYAALTEEVYDKIQI